MSDEEVAERSLVYIVENTDGRVELLKRSEFLRRIAAAHAKRQFWTELACLCLDHL